MKKSLKLSILFVLFISLAYNSNAQNYTITPSKAPLCQGVCNTLNEYRVDFVNNTSNKMVLTWKYLYTDLPACWDVSLCVLGPCYIAIPDSAFMDTVQVGGSGFLKLNVLLYDSGGYGKAVFYVYENGFPNSGDTITFDITTFDCTKYCTGWIPSNVETKKALPNISLRSNLVHEFLEIKGNQNGEISMEIWDIQGRKVFQHLIYEISGINTIDISSLRQGAYVLRSININSSTSIPFYKY